MKGRGTSILIAGIGGQGVVLAGDIMARALVNEGYDVKVSALRGIAQRGGLIFSHVRAGDKIYSPLIPKGEADILMTLELVECARQVEYLKKKGSIFFLDKYISQGAAKAGIVKVHCVITKSLKENFGARAIQIPYDEAVKNSRDVIMLNMFMLGVLSSYLFISYGSWLKAIFEILPRKMRDNNLSVFSAGINYRDKIS